MSVLQAAIADRAEHHDQHCGLVGARCIRADVVHPVSPGHAPEPPRKLQPKMGHRPPERSPKDAYLAVVFFARVLRAAFDALLVEAFDGALVGDRRGQGNFPRCFVTQPATAA